MMRTMMTTVALVLGALLAQPAAAQARFGVALEKHGRRQHVSLRIGFGGLPLRPAWHGHVHTDGCRRWIPPHCDTVTERRWVEGRCERVWVPPVYRVITDSCGRSRRVCVRAGTWNTIHHPGRWQTVTREVHVPGRWQTTCGH